MSNHLFASYDTPTSSIEDSRSFFEEVGEEKSESNYYIWIVLVVFVLILTGVVIGIVITENNMSSMERAMRILSDFPLVDGHIDVPEIVHFRYNGKVANIDMLNVNSSINANLVNLQDGKVGAFFMSAYVDCSTQFQDAVVQTLNRIDIINRIERNYSKYFSIARSSRDIRTNFRRGKISLLIGVEGGHSIDSSMSTLRILHSLGARYLTLTHFCNTPWAESSNSQYPSAVTGLSSFGKEVVREMNRIGMMVDLSHVSVNTMRDALQVSTAPVIFSHSSVQSLCNHPRNVPNEIIDMLPANGGLMMITFVSAYLSENDDATIDTVIEHIEYVIDRIGDDHVGLGSDFDGAGPVSGIESPAKYPTLVTKLLDRGHSQDTIIKIIGGNLLRVLAKVESHATSLGEQPPQEMYLSETAYNHQNFPNYTLCKTGQKN